MEEIGSTRRKPPPNRNKSLPTSLHAPTVNLIQAVVVGVVVVGLCKRMNGQVYTYALVACTKSLKR